MGTWGRVRGEKERLVPPCVRVCHAGGRGDPGGIEGLGCHRTEETRPRRAGSRCLPGEEPGELGRPRDGAAGPVPVNAGSALRGGGSLFPAAPSPPRGSAVVLETPSLCSAGCSPRAALGQCGARGAAAELWGQPLPPSPKPSPSAGVSLGGSAWGTGGGSEGPEQPLLGPGGFLGWDLVRGWLHPEAAAPLSHGASRDGNCRRSRGSRTA